MIRNSPHRFPVKQINFPPKEYPWAYTTCLTPKNPSLMKRNKLIVPREVREEFDCLMGVDRRATDHRPNPESKLPPLSNNQFV